MRKSGVTHGQPGLTATELDTRTAIRKAKLQLQAAKKLARQLEAESSHSEICDIVKKSSSAPIGMVRCSDA